MVELETAAWEVELDIDEVDLLIMASDGIAFIPGSDLLKITWTKAADMVQTIGEKWGLHRDDEIQLGKNRVVKASAG
ncbi:MAG: hypothetical protein ACOX6I_07900 [Syntrophomonadaceae bacterium]|jgi:hypothetical protein